MNDPFALFTNWYDEARQSAPVNSDIVALACATRKGRPSVRMVFYRGIREGGFSFFTNYESRKGQELSENPFAAMVFYWPHLGKQVRLEGPVDRLSPAESDAYFQGRPFRSQVTASVSRQSRPLPGENEFLERLAEVERSSGGKIERPPEWGGYKLVPSLLEFWEHGDHRRHNRIQYRRSGAAWTRAKLYP